MPTIKALCALLAIGVPLTGTALMVHLAHEEGWDLTPPHAVVVNSAETSPEIGL